MSSYGNVQSLLSGYLQQPAIQQFSHSAKSSKSKSSKHNSSNQQQQWGQQQLQGEQQLPQALLGLSRVPKIQLSSAGTSHAPLEQETLMVSCCGQSEEAAHPTPGIKTQASIEPKWRFKETRTPTPEPSSGLSFCNRLFRRVEPRVGRDDKATC